MKTKPQKQVVQTIKLLIALLGEPRATAPALAKAVGQTESWVNVRMMQFREAGLDIDYDMSKRQYRVDISDKLKEKLEPLSRKVTRAIEEANLDQAPEVSFVSALNRYSVKQFAEMIGTVPTNVYNMLTGYKGAKLPAGFVGYQVAGAGKWQIQKMDTDKSGKKFLIPENVKLAKTIVVGEGAPVKMKDVLHKSRCIVEGCGKQVMSRGYCSEHYYQARRHPEQYPRPQDKLPWPPRGSIKKKAA